VRDGFATLNLVKTLADSGEKSQPPGDGWQARIGGQPLKGFQGKLFIAHAANLPEAPGNCNGLNGNGTVSRP
jgi:hypothetical protein